MTVSDPGAGQQQPDEVPFRTGMCRAEQHTACARQRISERCACSCHPAAPSAQPDPGAGQQQGREVRRVELEHAGELRAGDVIVETEWGDSTEWTFVVDRRAPSSAPPARDSGRDEAREAVAVELSRHQGLRGPMDDERPDVWQNRCECGWDDGDETPGWRVRYRLHVADAVVHLPAVSRPLVGAAPTACHHLLGEHSRVPGVGCLVYLAPAVDGDPLTFCPCTHPGTSDADQ